MNVLVLDRSGRGHAFAELLARTDMDVLVHYVPGCAAIRTERVVAAPQVALTDVDGILSYARSAGIELVLVTNTQAIVDGLVDHVRRAGFPVIGPSRRAARLESSKVYAKDVFARYGIPSPEYRVFDDAATAHRWVEGHRGESVVVKADGLCGGNGAFVCDDEQDAHRAIDRLMVERVFGASGDRIVVERRLYGQEFSYFALLDGQGHLALPLAMDYPKSDDGNRGVTSAGMGALSHHPLDTPELRARVEHALLRPLLAAIADADLEYTGVIYLGCMLVDEEPVLLEVNARMGDPEAEVVLPRIESDFIEICAAILAGKLDRSSLELNDRHYCDVVATQGPSTGEEAGRRIEYPGWPFGTFSRHHPVRGLGAVDPAECTVFIGEATVEGGTLVSDGGRVLHLVGFGATRDEAVERAYRHIARVSFEGIRYRTDVGRVMPWEQEEEGEQEESELPQRRASA